MNAHALNLVNRMSSSDLLELVNGARLENDETPIRRNDFTKRCIDELDGEHYESFVVENLNGTVTTVLKLSEDQCMYVLMRESKSVRRKVTAKLRQKSQYSIPTTLSGALRLAADQAEQIEQQQAALAIAAPKVAFVDRYVESTGNKGFREVCKLLKANENRFREFLIDEKIMYRLGGTLTPMAQHLDAGRFEVKTGSSDEGHTFNQSKFTPKGVNWIAGEWAKYQLGVQQ